ATSGTATSGTATSGTATSGTATSGTATSGTAATERSGIHDAAGLIRWLRTLEPPTGLFACNDIRGQQVLNACRRAGVDVPDGVAVVSVDDDDVICPLCDPPLSSVRPDAAGVGYRAAEILHGLLRGRRADSRLELAPPAGVTGRLSTQVSATRDREVARASRFIREHACDGIKVPDVVRHVSLSRRQLERRFRAGIGRTIHQEITAAQVARVRQLLAETDLPLERLAPLAGYEYKEMLSSVYKRETGETPGGYRRRVKAASK
ncbi:substrate-binding domain-containing protein, partial [Alienimonas sp. DA493]|uniref:substrate-binding domain-containing protein n=1 Tax=Alienimonas sp. DA493 TaxID=3373605 RepID=UPI00375445AF